MSNEVDKRLASSLKTPTGAFSEVGKYMPSYPNIYADFHYLSDHRFVPASY